MLLRAVVLLAALTPLAAQDLASRGQTKLDKLGDGEYKAHEVVEFPPEEINAWAARKVPEVVPEGLRNGRVELGNGTVIASALVDFAKIRRTTNPLVARLIEGEHPLKVFMRLQSSGGRCTVYLTRVELAGIVLEGTVLDFLIQNFFKTLFPDSKINQPFEIGFDIDRIEVTPQAVRVTLR